MPYVPVLCGPTACGKTAAALTLFGAGDYTAVSADSMQIYRYMDIATAKPSSVEQKRLPHRLIDIRNPDETYTTGDFFRDAVSVIETKLAAGEKICVVGGTGLYIRSLIDGFCEAPPRDEALRKQLNVLEDDVPGSLFARLQQEDPETAARLHPNDRLRIIRALEVKALSGRSIAGFQQENRESGLQFRLAALIRDRNVLAGRIHERVEKMFAEGLLEEAAHLREMGYDRQEAVINSLGYQECFHCLDGKMSREAAIEAIGRKTRAFAVRQIKLFKKIPGMVWYHADDLEGLRRYFHIG